MATAWDSIAYLPPADGLPAWLGPACLIVGAGLWIAAASQAEPSTAAAVPPMAAAADAPAAEAVSPLPASQATPTKQKSEPAEAKGPAISVPDPPADAPAPPAAPCAPALAFAFEPGESRSTSASIGDAQAFVTWVNEHAAAKVVVEGYASADGSPGNNLRLSHARGLTVQAQLVELGLGSERIVVQAFGEYRPSVTDDAGDQDRRAVVRVDGMPTCAPEATP